MIRRCPECSKREPRLAGLCMHLRSEHGWSERQMVLYVQETLVLSAKTIHRLMDEASRRLRARGETDGRV